MGFKKIFFKYPWATVPILELCCCLQNNTGLYEQRSFLATDGPKKDIFMSECPSILGTEEGVRLPGFKPYLTHEVSLGTLTSFSEQQCLFSATKR